jgi:dephospho-CoA kinase
VAVRRLVSSRGMQEEDVRARMSRQATREERLARADLVIDNSGTLEELEARIAALWPEIEALGKAVDP